MDISLAYFSDVFWFSTLIGVFAGLSAGLFGLGGGLVIVPSLVWLFSWYGMDEHVLMLMAIATSLAAIVPTSLSSIIAHYRLGAIDWRCVFRLVPGIILGAMLGAYFADEMDGRVLRWVFIVYLFYVGRNMAMQIKPVYNVVGGVRYLDYFAGGVIGVVSSLLGIGGGTLTVPYLSGQGVDMKKAVAISSACGLPIAISSSASFAVLGQGQGHLPAGSIGYVYPQAFMGIVILSILTAPLGAKLANYLPAKKLRRYFSLVLFVMAIKMIVLMVE